MSANSLSESDRSGSSAPTLRAAATVIAVCGFARSRRSAWLAARPRSCPTLRRVQMVFWRVSAACQGDSATTSRRSRRRWRRGAKSWHPWRLRWRRISRLTARRIKGCCPFAPMTEALRALGFAAVRETAIGRRAMVGLAHGEYTQAQPDRWPIISSSCPVVINLVEQYYPDLIPHLAPQVSPMIAHGRYLHSQYGDDRSSCSSARVLPRKPRRPTMPWPAAMDAALTYDELARWMADVGVMLNCADGAGVMDAKNGPLAASADEARDCEGPLPEAILPMRTRLLRATALAMTWLQVGRAPRRPPLPALTGTPARLFPLEGGLLGTARLSTDLLSPFVFVGSGMDICRNVLEGIRTGGWQTAMVELMACSGGCINGPALAERGSIALSRQRVQHFAEHHGPQQPPPASRVARSAALSSSDRSTPAPQFSEAADHRCVASGRQVSA